MGCHNFEDLKAHIGHKVACVCYRKEGKSENPIVNVAVECETCNEVLVDFDR